MKLPPCSGLAKLSEQGIREELDNILLKRMENLRNRRGRFAQKRHLKTVMFLTGCRGDTDELNREQEEPQSLDTEICAKVLYRDDVDVRIYSLVWTSVPQ